MIGRNYRLVQQIAIDLAFVAIFALNLHGAWHIGSHVASHLQAATLRPAVVAAHRQALR